MSKITQRNSSGRGGGIEGFENVNNSNYMKIVYVAFAQQHLTQVIINSLFKTYQKTEQTLRTNNIDKN